MNKLLLISYLFPPAGGVGVQRALAFARYLPQNGFEVHVLQARNPAVAVHDPDLARRIPPEVRRAAAFTPEIPFRVRQKVWSLLKRGNSSAPAQEASKPAGPPGGLKGLVMNVAQRIFDPEPEILWAPFALRAARPIVREHGITHVMVTAPPFSCFVIGNQLKREFPHLKYISDWRDEWITYYLGDFEFQSGEQKRRTALRIERETIEASDLVVAVTESALAEIRSRHQDQPAEKFRVMMNGYDPDSFKEFRPRPRQDDAVLLTFTGTVHKSTDPQGLITAWRGLPDNLRRRVRLRFVGRVPESYEGLFAGAPAIERLGFQPQDETFRLLEETDYQLLIMTSDLTLSGKMFEYLATGKPILALANRDSETSRVLGPLAHVTCVEPYDTAGIQQALRHCLEARERGLLPPPPPREVVERYARTRLAAEYADAMRALTAVPATQRAQV